MWGDMGRCRETWGDMGGYGAFTLSTECMEVCWSGTRLSGARVASAWLGLDLGVGLGQG